MRKITKNGRERIMEVESEGSTSEEKEHDDRRKVQKGRRSNKEEGIKKRRRNNKVNGIKNNREKD